MWEAGAWLLGSAFVSASLLPGGSELVLAGLVVEQPAAWPLWIGLATLGNVLGSLTSWGLGRWLSARKPAEAFTGRGQQRALGWLRHHGAWSLLLAWLPVVGDGLCLLAGWLRWSFWLCTLLIALGKLGRYLVVAALAAGFIE